jgi:hypothetical protein
MRVVFFVPLSCIALYEATMSNNSTKEWMNNWLRDDNEGADVNDRPETRDPDVPDDEENGLKISKVKFAELIQVFPNTAQVWNHPVHSRALIAGLTDLLVRSVDGSVISQ